ncbi:GNAT family N-acetyltransferase [Nocardioides bruguierae]|uniref:GNAT family N-acetyltransferase n=1 Tax=Nocardioides bruguierae TaxID=2945102 RepID=A0A9X2IHA0_9ACTN|nr:GNAT family protein [Nocardioides bruguierae]MCM0622823.1 GNAT family N-acetyltransferase [Nocardioides bruguierae]
MRTLWPARAGDLVLRRPQPSELDDLLALRNDPACNRFMMRTHVEPETFRREWLSPGDGDHSCVAALDGRVVAIGFLEVEDGMGQPGMPRGTQASIGYLVSPGHWGRGVASALVGGLLTAAFDHLGLRRVTAGCNADNHASTRVLEKNGMRREQHGVEDSWHADLGWVDGYTYALLAREWRAR